MYTNNLVFIEIDKHLRKIKKKFKKNLVELIQASYVKYNKVLGKDLIKKKQIPLGLALELDISRKLQFLQWKKKIYEPHIFCLAQKVLKKGDTVIDAGAHIGYWALIFSRLVGASGKVFAFEPELQNWQGLLKSIELNAAKNIHAEQCGLSNVTEERCLLKCEHNDGGHSIVFDSDLQGTEKISTKRLDDFLAKEADLPIKLVKMDVEGHEQYCLEGMTKMLSGVNKPQHLIIEVSRREPERRQMIYEIVSSYGYVSLDIHKLHQRKPVGPLDGGEDMYFCA